MATESTSSPSQDTQVKGQWPLWRVVALGFIVSCAALFLALWYFAYQATYASPTTWKWFPNLTQDEMFLVIRNAVTAVAALGVGVTLFLSYRRQHVAERTLQLSAQAQSQAAKALELSSKSHELTRQQHEREYENQLRSRYSTAAQQIGENNPSLVIAGCISMATIADEWHQLDRPSDRDDCIRMLIAALPEGSLQDSGNHLRRSTIQSIFEGRMSDSGLALANWSSAPVDFESTRAPFGTIVGWTIRGRVKITSAQLSFGSESAVISSSSVQGGDLTVSMTSPDRDYLLFSKLALKKARLRVNFPFLPAEGESSKVVFRASSFDASSLELDEPNSPCLPRTIVFENCRFSERTIAVLGHRSNAYRLVFVDCTFVTNPFHVVGVGYSPDVQIELKRFNNFVGAMRGFPEHEPEKMLDENSWFFPEEFAYTRAAPNAGK